MSESAKNIFNNPVLGIDENVAGRLNALLTALENLIPGTREIIHTILNQSKGGLSYFKPLDNGLNISFNCSNNEDSTSLEIGFIEGNMDGYGINLKTCESDMLPADGEIEITATPKSDNITRKRSVLSLEIDEQDPSALMSALEAEMTPGNLLDKLRDIVRQVRDGLKSASQSLP